LLSTKDHGKKVVWYGAAKGEFMELVEQVQEWGKWGKYPEI